MIILLTVWIGGVCRRRGSLQVVLALWNVENLREQRRQCQLCPIHSEPVQVRRVFRAQVPQFWQFDEEGRK